MTGKSATAGLSRSLLGAGGAFWMILAGAVPAASASEPLRMEACGSEAATAEALDFGALMKRVSDGWSTQDTDLALGAFTDDALYTEPPNLQIYRGKTELRNFFNAVTPGSSMIWRHLWYDAATSTGAGEYSFHKAGRDTAVHGVAVVEIRCGQIRRWREYQRRGDISYDEFHDPETKNWETTGADFR